MCGDWHRAQDIVQTAVAKLYVHWRRAKRANDIDAYVRRIVVRVFLDEQRLAWSRVRRMASVPEPASAHRLDADDRIVLLEALAKIPPRQRAVLVLRFWEDLSVEQTAELLRCSTGNIKSQTARGLATMRKLLPHPLHPDPVSGPAR
jgi:RNA polymerase sigma-70 factor (sigma-E family)